MLERKTPTRQRTACLGYRRGAWTLGEPRGVISKRDMASERRQKGQAVGAGFTLSLSLLPFLAGSGVLPVPVSVGTFGVRWGVQAVGQVLVAVTGTVGHVGS